MHALSCGVGVQTPILSAVWLNFQMLSRMNNDPLSPVLNQLYPGARVHHGFLDQFQAVTDQAANASQNIRCAYSITFRTRSGCSLQSLASLHDACSISCCFKGVCCARGNLHCMQSMHSAKIIFLCMAPWRVLCMLAWKGLCMHAGVLWMA